MNKEFIPYEQALALKELGFDEECMFVYREKNLCGDYDIESSTGYSNKTSPKHYRSRWVSAPLYQQAFKFFRDKYNLDSSIHRNGGMHIDERGPLPFYEVIIRHKSPELKCVKHSYEEAELACLRKLIEIVKK